MVPGSRPGRAMRVSSLLALVAAAVLAVALPPPSAAHSSMTVPRSLSFTTDCRVGGPRGNKRNCPGPCPNVMLRRNGWGSSPQKPAATYARGEDVTVRWARNNHEGGFVRWALVPVDQMNDAEAHERYAFRWGCWSAGRFTCNAKNRRQLCIDDRLSQPVAQAFSERLEVPTVVPDGDYVLSFAWYGGVRDNKPWRRPVLSSFGDYYDCSYVRISGGVELEASQPRLFVPGRSTRFPDRCVSAVDALGKCAIEPCTDDETDSGKSLHTGGELVPAQFADGAEPPPLTAADYLDPDDTLRRLPQTPPSPTDAPSATEPETTAAPVPTPPAPAATPSPAATPTPMPNGWVGIQAFYVVNTRGDRSDALSLSSVNEISQSQYPDGFSVEAVTRGNVLVESVTFAVNKVTKRIERFPRWALMGDHKGYWAPWRDYKVGRVMRVTARPWSSMAAKMYWRGVRVKVVA